MALDQEQETLAKELLLRIEAKDSLHSFIKQAWRYLEGDKPFIDGWHIQAICEHLEAVKNRDIRNLLINIPPRSTKSSLVSVCFPAWVFIDSPQEQFMYASYSASISIRDSVKCRRLIESPWYQSRWGNCFKLVGDQNTKSKFENDKTGYRIATSSNSSVTGEGGSILVCDDPNNAQDGESEAKRESTSEWWDNVWSTRLNDPKADRRVVVQQRIHEDDISGHIMKNDSSNSWVKLILPMEYEANRKSKTIILPSTNGKVWEDPRTKEGELLWPQRIGPKELEQLKIDLGSEYSVSGQLQQRPSPAAGGILKKSWFRWWKSPRPPQIEHVIQSWDTALEANERNNFSACSTWGIFYDNNRIFNLILLSLWRGTVEYPELRKIAQHIYYDYRYDPSSSNNRKPDGNHMPDVVLVEAKVSGISLVQDLIKAGISATRFDPNRYGDKIHRVRLISHLIEAGRVWVPAKEPDYKRLRNFADLLVEQCGMFPNASSRDIVDTMTQVLLRLNASGWLSNPMDGRGDNDTSVRAPTRAYYDD